MKKIKKSTKIRLRNLLATWKLLIILIPLIFLALTFLRLDHIRMTELRARVLEADSALDTELLASSMTELQDFVRTHIVINIIEKNGKTEILFGTGPFYLEKSYEKAAENAILEAEKKLNNGETTGNIYLDASNVCKPQAISGGWAWNSPEYIACMTGELAKNPTSADIVDSLVADVPPTDLYRHEFSSPVWTFSASGVVLLLCAILLVVILTRFFIWILIRLSLLFMKS